MYKLSINGDYRGHYDSMQDALAKVEEWARPFGLRWTIEDGYGNIVAQS